MTVELEELMLRYQNGDQHAFSELFRKTAPMVACFLRPALSDPNTVEELVQQTFLKFHQARSSFQPGRKVKPWLLTIAANLRKDELRKRYRLPKHAGEDAIDEAVLANSGPRVRLASEVDPKVRIRAALESLPESQRIVIELHRFEALTFEDIAQVLNTSPGAVRVRASRAYSALKDALGSFAEVS